jgi:hypothetical protein
MAPSRFRAADGVRLVPLLSPADKRAVFSPAESKAIRAEARLAAPVIVRILTGIITLALVVYLIVAIMTSLVFGERSGIKLYRRD